LQSQCSDQQTDIRSISGPAQCTTQTDHTTTMAPSTDCYLRNTKYEPVDMVGTERTEEPSEEMCQCRCANTKGCAHFSFWPDGGCHLQSNAAVAVDALKISSGPASCYAPSLSEQPTSILAGHQGCFMEDTKYELLQMPGTEVTEEESAEMCQCRCAQTRNCGYFTFMDRQNKCYLAGASAEPLVANGKTAGPWSCTAQGADMTISNPSPGQTLNCITPNTKYEPVMQAKVTREESAEVCQCRCAITAGCGFFSYDDEGRCSLHPVHATAVFKPYVTGGPAMCFDVESSS